MTTFEADRLLPLKLSLPNIVVKVEIRTDHDRISQYTILQNIMLRKVGITCHKQNQSKIARQGVTPPLVLAHLD